MIIPRPVELVAEPGEFDLGPRPRLCRGPGAERAAALLAGLVHAGWQEAGPATATDPAGVGAGEASDRAVHLAIEPDGGPAPQGYRLAVRTDEVRLTAPDEAGLFNGVQTLRHLVRPTASGAGWPCLTVTDAPLLPWRGLLLDVARHFLPLPFLYEVVDILAAHKLNVLHLHLTDDQGWRIEIAGLPRLTEVGGWRAESMAGPAGCDTFDGVPHGGYYTQDELRGLVGYADARGVTIVPEIGVPGHVRALLAAYPELGNEADRRLPVWTEWGVSEHILGVHEEVFELLDTVLDQVVAVFPSPYVHIGGDECPTVEWENAPRAKALARELGLSSPARLHGWFLGRVQELVARHGRRTISWAEAELHGDLDTEMVLAAWLDAAHGAQGVRRGHQVLMAPHLRTYLDYPQRDDPAEPPGNPKEIVTLADVYAFDPVPGGLPVAVPGRPGAGVLGAQAQLWTEHVSTAEHARYLLLPRLCAFAEAAWSVGQRDLAEFGTRLGPHLARLPLRGPARPSTGTEPEAQPGTGPGTGAEAEPGAEAGTGAEAEPGAEAGTEAETW